jgi:phosphohistidine phosphatase
VATLLLLRHAKSAWPPGVEDRQRPLTRRGERACQTIGRFLAANNLLPDRVVASPAVRATETARLVLRAAGSLVPVATDERVYDDDVIAAVAESALAGGVERLLVVGHEPGVMGAVTMLSGAVVALPTGTLVVLELSPDDSEGAVLRLVVPPRMLEAWAGGTTPG